MTRAVLPYTLTAYGLPHVMGYLPAKDGVRHPEPLGPTGFMDTAVRYGLAGVDMPLPSTGDEEVRRFRDALEERGLQFVAEYGGVLSVEAAVFRTYLGAAAAAGASLVRATLSNILCGDRRKLEGGWDAHLSALAARLRELLPAAADLDLTIAVENHQDATTDDLLQLGEMVGGHPAFGVTLDAGNPLAVGEEPVEAARRLAPILRHLHLKDYTIHFAPEGYRLVRCPAGQGVVDFPAILAIARANGRVKLPGIEIGAQATRTIPLLEESWWACHAPRPATGLLGALRILWEKGRGFHEPYSSAWERGEDSNAVAREEWEVLDQSVAYFRSLETEGAAG